MDRNKIVLSCFVFLIIYSTVVMGQEVKGNEKSGHPELKWKTNNWVVRVLSIDNPESLKAYMPTGEVTEKDSVHGYIVGTVTPKEGVQMVVVKFDVQNISNTSQSFCIGDISCKNSKNEIEKLAAIGQGDLPPYTKFSQVEQKMASKTTVNFEPKEKIIFTYVFGKEKKEPPLLCTFQNGNWIELK
jgi:hypothetical protein